MDSLFGGGVLIKGIGVVSSKTSTFTPMAVIYLGRIWKAVCELVLTDKNIISSLIRSFSHHRRCHFVFAW